MGGTLIIEIIDVLAGAIFDILKFIIRSISYLLGGMIIVAVPMYILVCSMG